MVETFAMVLAVLFVLLALFAHLRRFLLDPAISTPDDEDFNRIIHEAKLRSSLRINFF